MGKQVTFLVVLTVEQDAVEDTLLDDVQGALDTFEDWRGAKDVRAEVCWPEPDPT